MNLHIVDLKNMCADCGRKAAARQSAHAAARLAGCHQGAAELAATQGFSQAAIHTALADTSFAQVCLLPISPERIALLTCHCITALGDFTTD